MAAIPLQFAKTGDEVRVIRTSGQEAMKKHLQDLGFVPGTDIYIVSSHGGDMIIKLKGARLAVTKEMAMKVYISA